MKKLLAFSASLAALVAALSWPGNADPSYRADAAAGGVSLQDVLTNLAIAGLSPLGQPIRRGNFYVLHAIDPRGIEVRVVTDTLFGDILSVSPARLIASVYAARYDSGPRIIHIPDRQSLRSPDPRDRGEDPTIDNGDATAAPRPDRQPPAPAAKRHHSSLPAESVAPPPQRQPKRSVLNVPPPPPAENLSPLKPTPRWRAAEKFAPPPAGPEPFAAPAATPEAANASANEPAALVPESIRDTPPDGPTLDPPPAMGTMPAR